MNMVVCAMQKIFTVYKVGFKTAKQTKTQLQQEQTLVKIKPTPNLQGIIILILSFF